MKTTLPLPGRRAAVIAMLGAAIGLGVGLLASLPIEAGLLPQPGVAGLLAAGPVTLSPAPVEEAQIDWVISVDQAFRDAKVRDVPVFLAVTMDGERANDQIAKVHFHDPRLVKASRNFACLVSNPSVHDTEGPCSRYGKITCSEHRAIEVWVRTVLLASGEIIAPQHMVLGQDRGELSAEIYAMPVEKLIALMAEGLVKVRPDLAGRLIGENLAGPAADINLPAGSPERVEAFRRLTQQAMERDAMARLALQAVDATKLSAAEATAVLDVLGAKGGDDERTRAWIARLVGARDAAIRLRAIRAITGAAADSTAFERLVERLPAEWDPECRAALLAALQVDVSGQALTIGHDDPDVRLRICEELARCGIDAVGPLLVQRLASKDGYIVNRAALALACLPPAIARPPLEKHLASGEVSRGAAARALSAMGDAQCGPALQKALTDENPLVRASAARALGVLGIREAAAPLRTLAKTDPIPTVKVEAAGALHALGEPDGDPVLNALLGHAVCGARAEELLRPE